MSIWRWLIPACFLALATTAGAQTPYPELGAIPKVPFVWSAQDRPIPDLAYVSARKVYDYMQQTAFPSFDESHCGEALMGVLVRVARASSVALKLDRGSLAAGLREKKCADMHFHILNSSMVQTSVEEECASEPVSLTWKSGIWVLRVSTFMGTWSEITPACDKQEEKIKRFLTKVHEKGTNFWPGDPYILDLRDNHGGSEYVMRMLLDSAFSPEPYADFYSIIRKKSGEVVESTEVGVFGCPRAVLINKETASAAEITTAAIMQLCPQVVLVGQKSYGKFAGTTFLPLGASLVQISVEIFLPGKPSAYAPRYNYVGLRPKVVTPEGAELEQALVYLNSTPAAISTQAHQ